VNMLLGHDLHVPVAARGVKPRQSDVLESVDRGSETPPS